MAEHEEHDITRIPERELSEFANSLFGHLYYKIDMHHYRVNSSRFFRENIGTAVILVRNATRDFNTKILDGCGYGVDKLTLCQEVCNLYPRRLYFQSLYYITGFILEMMYWWYKMSDAIDFSQGPRMWQTIFRVNFESEFETERGWEGLFEAAVEWHDRLLFGILPSEKFLPEMVQGVVARVRPLNPEPQRAVSDEAEAALERLRAGQMEIDDDPSDESMQSEEGIEKNQPVKGALVEESKEGHPGVMDDRPGPSGIGGNVAQTEHLGESSSGISGEDVSRRLGDGNRRKRRLDAPSEMDSNEESDSLSPSRAKMDKKESEV